MKYGNIEVPDEKPLEETALMPFGLHKGKKMQDVPISYLFWLLDQPWFGQWPRVKAYALKKQEESHQAFVNAANRRTNG